MAKEKPKVSSVPESPGSSASPSVLSAPPLPPTPSGTPQQEPKKPDINEQLESAIKAFEVTRGARVLPLFLSKAAISAGTVDDIFDTLREKYNCFETTECDRLDVILDSSGGAIDAAYNIGLLLRRYAKRELNIIVPRWAKSAATVIACAGDRIYMTPVAELGPVDPQIKMHNPLENRLEEFSPLDIGSTLELIRNEFSTGQIKLAQGLLERLQFPLTLGGIKKSLDVGINYIERLLSSRMFKDVPEGAKKVKEIAKHLVEDYATHAFCIEIDEAQRLGLRAELLPSDQTNEVWKIYKLAGMKEQIEKQRKKEELQQMLKNLPPEAKKSIKSRPPNAEIIRGGDEPNDAE